MPLAMPPQRQRLVLVVPAELTPAQLSQALGASDIAAVVVGTGGGGTDALVEAAQLAGIAALVALDPGSDAAPAWPVRYGADGLHLFGDEAASERVLKSRVEGATVGACARSRHSAMLLGEAGADYVCFGSTGGLDVDGLEVACWWQALFEVPAIAAGPAEEGAVRSLIATRVEFIAVNVFDANDPAALVAAINRELDSAGGVR